MCALSGNQIFKSLLFRREWHIDDEGIHEFRKGALRRSIGWADLHRFDDQTIRAADGAKLSLSLPTYRLSKFRSVLRSEWRRRFPESYAANEAWVMRRRAFAVFIWMSLYFFFIPAASYLQVVFSASLGRSTHELLLSANRMALFSGVVVALLWIWFAYTYTKSRND